MGKQRIKNKDSYGLHTIIMAVALFAAVFAIVAAGLSDASGSVDSEGARVAEQAIRRGVVSCYAVEGCYPESFDYLCENYGVAINEDKYIVHYSVFASNLMPEVTVIARGGAE